MENSLENQTYCRELVRSDDHERFLMSLFAPSRAQRAIWAVLAFNQEIAKIRENVSETALGEIRLQWWSEVLAEIQAGEVREQPVIQELAELYGQEAVWGLLGEMLEARRFDMFQESAKDLTGLEAYADGVGGALHAAILHLCCPENVASDAVIAARAAGAGWAMMGLIRALPFHWQVGRSMLPEENDAAMQMREAAKAFDALKPTIQKMKAFVEGQLDVVESHKSAVPRVGRAALLDVPLVKLHLKTLENVGDNPFEMPPHEAGDLRKMTSMFWANLTGRL